ncbi:MAG: hypothetical protein D3925_15100 [Candidatus Electrothrix sp. AR5]|nr:hypothetical protein [Candidatus Electrothrix sp. AR5]
MAEQKLDNLDLDAILANEEFAKKLTAKVLDLIGKKPDSGVICQGYFCDMANDDLIKGWKELWKEKLNTLDMEIEDGLTESAIDEYPVSAEELDQVVTEIKTSDAYAKKLSRPDLSRAVSKVLADNEIMRRKGSMKVEAAGDAERMFAPCKPCSPNTASLQPFYCITCGPSDSHMFSECKPCSPNNLSHPFIQCTPCSPDNLSSQPFIECNPCSPNSTNKFSDDPCKPCSPYFSSLFSCSVCGPHNINKFTGPCKPGSPFTTGCKPCSPYNPSKRSYHEPCWQRFESCGTPFYGIERERKTCPGSFDDKKPDIKDLIKELDILRSKLERLS